MVCLLDIVLVSCHLLRLQIWEACRSQHFQSRFPYPRLNSTSVLLDSKWIYIEETCYFWLWSCFISEIDIHPLFTHKSLPVLAASVVQTASSPVTNHCSVLQSGRRPEWLALPALKVSFLKKEGNVSQCI